MWNVGASALQQALAITDARLPVELINGRQFAPGLVAWMPTTSKSGGPQSSGAIWNHNLKPRCTDLHERRASGPSARRAFEKAIPISGYSVAGLQTPHPRDVTGAAVMCRQGSAGVFTPSFLSSWGVASPIAPSLGANCRFVPVACDYADFTMNFRRSWELAQNFIAAGLF